MLGESSELAGWVIRFLERKVCGGEVVLGNERKVLCVRCVWLLLLLLLTLCVCVFLICFLY